MKLRKCLIIIEPQAIDKINLADYKVFIGVEKGALFLLEQKDLKNRNYIADFDSVSSATLNKIKKEASNNLIILPKEREFVDGEEAIKLANKLGYFAKEIDLLINEDQGRKDHLFNVMNLVYKYNINVLGKKIKIISLLKKQKEIIYQEDYHFLSFFIFEETTFKTKGLKWDLNNKTYSLKQATGLISNQIKKESCEVLVSHDSLVVLSND